MKLKYSQHYYSCRISIVAFMANNALIVVTNKMVPMVSMTTLIASFKCMGGAGRGQGDCQGPF